MRCSGVFHREMITLLFATQSLLLYANPRAACAAIILPGLREMMAQIIDTHLGLERQPRWNVRCIFWHCLVPQKRNFLFATNNNGTMTKMRDNIFEKRGRFGCRIRKGKIWTVLYCFLSAIFSDLRWKASFSIKLIGNKTAHSAK